MSQRRGQSSGRDWITILVLAAMLALVIAFLVWQWRQRSQPVALSGQAQGLVYGGPPRAGEEVQLLTNRAYVVGYSNRRKNPLWVGYKLFHVDQFVYHERPAGFSVDPRTSARVRSEDYKAPPGMGLRDWFDRGHMAPNHAIMVCYGAEAQLETFLMSNVCPQYHSLNAGAWERLEKRELDEFAMKNGAVWVLDGPIFEEKPRELGENIQIPSAFYKILVEERGGKPRALAFIMPQGSSPRELTGRELPEQYLTSVGEVERQSRLEFFGALSADVRQESRSAAAARMW